MGVFIEINEAPSCFLRSASHKAPSEARESLIPKTFQPASQCLHAPHVDRVQPARAFGAIRHKTRLFEHLEVLGHSWLADVHSIGDLSY
jgi:hypothetical protein